MPRKPHIFHLIPMNEYRPYAELLAGIAEYARLHTEWRFFQTWTYSRQKQKEQLELLCKTKNIDGCIACIEDEFMLETLHSLSVPVVEVSMATNQNLFPVCAQDPHETGKMAANYLMDQGYYNLIMPVRSPRNYFRNLMSKSFIDQASARGVQVHYPDYDNGGSLDLLKKHLPGQAAFMYNHESLLRFRKFALSIDVNIPENLGLLTHSKLGIHADLQMNISAVIRPLQTVGWNAARILNEILQGQSVPDTPTLIKPLGIHEDESTSALPFKDPLLKAAVLYIKSHFAEPIGIEDIVNNAALSRRSLEMRFQESLGMSPRKYLEKIRLQEARQLLINSEMSIALVSTHAGFSSPKRMTDVFKAHQNITPRQYRDQYRHGSLKYQQ